MVRIIARRTIAIVLIATLFAAGFFFGKYHAITCSEIKINDSMAILILDGQVYEYRIGV